MKKTISFVGIFLTISSIILFSFTNTVLAAESYYLEIGKPASVEETHEQWSELTSQYKSTLGKLKFFPKARVDSLGNTTNTIQAGPINAKHRAQKICNILFSKDIPCFVIEGIEKTPPTMSVRMKNGFGNKADELFILPPQERFADNSETMGQDTSVSSNIVPYADSMATDADVDVAEAIPVPLTNRTNEKRIEVQPDAIEETKPALSVSAPLVSFSSKNSGNLIIEKFSNESSAYKFWNYASKQRPDLIEGLRIKIQRPLVLSRTGGIQLSVGQFEDGYSAANFCNGTINGYDSKLRCSYEVSNTTAKKSDIQHKDIEPVNSNDTEQKFIEMNKSAHSSAYTERRRILQRSPPSQQHEIFKKTIDKESSASSNKFWAQVALSDSKEEAKNRLTEIQKDNSDVLGDSESSIVRSPSSHAKYAVRIGPFIDENEANKICDNLQLRGIDCLMIATK